jgi:hypothetical protein
MGAPTPAAAVPMPVRAAASVTDAGAHDRDWQVSILRPPAPPAPMPEEKAIVHRWDLSNESPLLNLELTGCFMFEGTPEMFRSGERLLCTIADINPPASWGLDKRTLFGEQVSAEHLRNVIVTDIEVCGVEVPDNFPHSHVCFNLKNTNINNPDRGIEGMYVAPGGTTPDLFVAHRGQHSTERITAYDWTKSKKPYINTSAMTNWWHVVEGGDREFYKGHRYMQDEHGNWITDVHWFPARSRPIELMDKNTHLFGKPNGLTFSQAKKANGEIKRIDGTPCIAVSKGQLKQLVEGLHQDVIEKTPCVSFERGVTMEMSLPPGQCWDTASAHVQGHEDEHRKFMSSQKRMMCVYLDAMFRCKVPATESILMAARATTPKQ